MDLISFLHLFGMWFKKIWKWGELRLIKLFIRPISWAIQKVCEQNGIIFNFTEESNGNDSSDQQMMRVAAKSKKFKDLVQIKVHDKSEFFARMTLSANLGLAEGYMDKVWSFQNSEEDIIQLARRLFESDMYLGYYYLPYNKLFEWLELYGFNLQTKSRAGIVAKVHYDLGNDLYDEMLGPWMQYSCGYWAKAKDLNEAQEHKLELIAKKLDLKPGMKILDIGCGFGILCKFLTERYHVKCVGITLSKEQAIYAREKCKGLEVEIRIQDYRDLDLNEKFDRVVSICAIEHFGKKNYREFMEISNRGLKDDGIMILQMSALSSSSVPESDMFLNKHIFPNGILPSAIDMIKSSDGLFVLEDWHNFGYDYVKTLVAWRDNFKQSWPKIGEKYGDRFYRMWIYYLCMCQGLFLTKNISLWQIVLSKEMKREYRAAR